MLERSRAPTEITHDHAQLVLVPFIDYLRHVRTLDTVCELSSDIVNSKLCGQKSPNLWIKHELGKSYSQPMSCFRDGQLQGWSCNNLFPAALIVATREVADGHHPVAGRFVLSSAICRKIKPSPINRNPIAAQTIEAHNKNPPIRSTQPQTRIDRLSIPLSK
jgi:hypothetical protein